MSIALMERISSTLPASPIAVSAGEPPPITPMIPTMLACSVILPATPAMGPIPKIAPPVSQHQPAPTSFSRCVGLSAQKASMPILSQVIARSAQFSSNASPVVTIPALLPLTVLPAYTELSSLLPIVPV